MNAEFELAEQFALHTRKHCFITGKAGTGKTTLLKRIVERTQKNVAVVAPTGVAAINAGGVTIHSMFGLPLTCFVPNDDFVDPQVATNRRRMQQEHVYFRKDKLRVLRELELLVIDEISMVRCDVLDAIDFVLRTVRGNARPFGDVQVLLFGDMHQLPPVVKEAEWNILQACYGGAYFFDSLVWPQLEAAEIELQTIYRQSDARFLALLSHVRDRRMDADDHARLRERYDPNFSATVEGYVLLTTHNHKADSVNTQELTRLPGMAHSFEARIAGEFPESLFPCEKVLHLKVGAQVMFIRNDAEEGRYYNGKLAVVKKVVDGNITVTFNDSREDYLLRNETWENIGYSVEADTGKVIKQELGSFSQLPLRLAWAITIHKSQGLTFDRVIIDAGRSFAAGQVYVALSRCRSLEGIVLHSLITPNALHSDRRIGEFSQSHHSTPVLEQNLAREKTAYASHLLLRLFTFTGLTTNWEQWQEMIAAKNIPDKEVAIALHASTSRHLLDINATADKFRRQLQRLIAAAESDPANAAALLERCAKAIKYFTDEIATQLITPLHEHTKSLAYKKKARRYVQQVRLLEDSCWNKVEQLYGSRFLDERLYSDAVAHTREAGKQVVTSVTSKKATKGGTYQDTLDLQRQGKTLEEIATLRSLTLSTIKGHMARWITKGEVNVYDVLPAQVVDPVLTFLEEHEGATLGGVRSALGEQYDYNDIRMIMSHHSRKMDPNRQPTD
jgi:DNA-binding NarL/FixJ family response regulator